MQDDGQRGTQGFLFYDREYWHPNTPPRFASRDKYKVNSASPTIPGLLDDAIRGFESPGMPMRWYSVYGNHDGLMQGNFTGVYPGGVRALHRDLDRRHQAHRSIRCLAPPDLQSATASCSRS